MWPCLYKTRAKISGRSTSKQHLNLRSTAHTHQCILSLRTSTVLLSITCMHSQRRIHAHSQVTRVVKHSHTNHVNQCKTPTELVVHSVSGTLQQRTLKWMPFQTWALNGFMALGEKSPLLKFSTYQISNHQFAQDKLLTTWEITSGSWGFYSIERSECRIKAFHDWHGKQQRTVKTKQTCLSHDCG